MQQRGKTNQMKLKINHFFKHNIMFKHWNKSVITCGQWQKAHVGFEPQSPTLQGMSVNDLAKGISCDKWVKNNCIRRDHSLVV